MAATYPTDIISQGNTVLEAWKKIGSEVKFGTLDVTALTTDLGAAKTLQANLDALDAQLTDLRNKRDALYTEVWDKVKRVRASVKGIYGDDSSEYEMVGGTRKSERKPVTRKAKAG